MRQSWKWGQSHQTAVEVKGGGWKESWLETPYRAVQLKEVSWAVRKVHQNSVLCLQGTSSPATSAVLSLCLGSAHWKQRGSGCQKVASRAVG